MVNSRHGQEAKATSAHVMPVVQQAYPYQVALQQCLLLFWLAEQSWGIESSGYDVVDR